MLKPLGSPPLHREIQRRIKAHILEQNLKAGDRLPTEPEMASQLQVSRNALREALKALEAIGLVEVRMGAGTFVASFDPVKYMDSFTHNLLVEGVDIDELYEIRQALERSFIDKVAECIGEDDLAELDGLLEEMERELANDSFTILTSLQLHPIIYRCLQNRFLDSFFDAYVAFVSRVWLPIFEPDTLELMQYTTQIHRDLVEALRRHDAGAARAALEKDLRGVDLTLQLAERSLVRTGTEGTEESQRVVNQSQAPDLQKEVRV
jgi:DNA-binding FadR family transcriptional regulator